jgi:23S rRNA (adenine2503-C2)-methyltransferase
MTGKPGGGRPKRGPGPARPGSKPRPDGPSQPGRAPRPGEGPHSGGAQRPGDRRPGGPVKPSGKPSPATKRPAAPAKSVPARQSTTAMARKDVSPQAVLETYRPDLAAILNVIDAPGFRYGQVFDHMMNRPAAPFSDASAVPVALRAALDEAGPAVMTVAATRMAPDGTTKLLLDARDGAQVEAVLMPYGSRLTACVSSQVGCAVGCAFCATGALGFTRNLSAAEIVDQLRAGVAAAQPGQRLTNVVYMGMGEPLLNMGAVLDSVRILTAPSGLGLGRRSLSISTVGIPSGIRRLARYEPQVNLALSLHAADDTTRAFLIPDAFRHPLAEVLDAAWEHFAVTRRKLLVEYVLIAGVNDSLDDARRLAALMRGHVVAVNLLTWNPVALNDIRARAARGGRQTRTFVPSPPAAVSAFRSALRAAHIEAVLRISKGAGIEAACGQLAGSSTSYEP